jgi:hypothetical protein
VPTGAAVREGQGVPARDLDSALIAPRSLPNQVPGSRTISLPDDSGRGADRHGGLDGDGGAAEQIRRGTCAGSLRTSCGGRDLVVLDIEIAHVVRNAKLSPHHRDPFDRLLVAQSLVEGLPVVTRDPNIALYGVHTIW